MLETYMNLISDLEIKTGITNRRIRNVKLNSSVSYYLLDISYFKKDRLMQQPNNQKDLHKYLPNA
jgi:hypothetical protein